MARHSDVDQAARLLSIVDRLVAEVRSAGRSSAALDSSLERDLGLDSLARVELLARIEQAFGVRLADELLGTAETPRDLLRAVAAGAPAAAETADQRAAWRAPQQGEQEEQANPDGAATLVEVLQWHASRHPRRPHVLFQRSATETDTLDYGQLLTTAREVAAGLRRSGVAPGQCVAMMLPKGLEFFHSFYGILLAGAIPAPIYPPTRPGQVEDHLRRQAGILQNCEAVALITFDAARLVARILSGLVPSLREVTTPDQLRADAGSAAAEDHRAYPKDIALLQYTSGSTGNPKGVTLDHGNLLANIRAWGQAVEMRATDVAVSWLPLYHDMGLIGAWLGSLYHACPLVLMSPLDFLARPERWLWAIHHHRGTITAAPNFAFELCLRHLDPVRLQGLDLSSWRYAANGAEPVAAETLSRFASAFAPYGFRANALAPVFGLAECSVGLAVSPPGRGPLIDRVRRESLAASGEAVPATADDTNALQMVACGRPLPGHEARIVDEAGRELPPRRVGRLEFRGPSATRGYYRNAEATAKLIHNGWLDSGDLAYLADGDIVITGRLKDTIIRGGRNIYPYELEEAVGAIPGVRRGCVAVFGVAVAGQGTEKLVVVAESRETDAGARRELIGRINSLAVDLLGTPPDDVVLAPPHAVLKTSSGKIRRAGTRDVYCGEGFGAGSRAPWLQVLRLGLAGFWQGLRGTVRRGGDLLYGGYAWCVWGLLALLAVAAIMLLPGVALRWRCVGALARTCIGLCGIRLRVDGLERLPSGTAVFVANHASYVDGVAVGAVLPPGSFVAKQELAAHPFAGPLLRRLGVAFVERFDARQGVDDVRRLAEVAGTRPLFFFAEGTFRREPGLRPFRLGAFQIAAQNRLAVTPVVLAGTREVLRDGTWLPRRVAVRVSICAPVAASGEGWQAALQLRDATRAAILAHCGEPDLEGGAP